MQSPQSYQPQPNDTLLNRTLTTPSFSIMFSLNNAPGISERFLVPLLEALLSQFPFAVIAFHADNGSEYINHRVAKLLNKLHIQKFTKKMATAIAVL